MGKLIDAHVALFFFLSVASENLFIVGDKSLINYSWNRRTILREFYAK